MPPVEPTIEPTIENLLATCEQAAAAGAEQLMAWRGRFTAKEKAAHDLVTDADLASQEAVHAVITAKFADHGFLGEESPDPEELSKPYCWVVDPLDGTTNYVHDFPFFAVSVAVAKEGQPVAGVILDPIRQECFRAGLGLGSQLNGKPLATSTTTDLNRSLVAVSFPPDLQANSPDLQVLSQDRATLPSRAKNRIGGPQPSLRRLWTARCPLGTPYFPLGFGCRRPASPRGRRGRYR